MSETENIYVVFPIKYSERLTHLLSYFFLYIFPIQDSEQGGRREVRNQGNLILEEEMEEGCLTLLVTIQEMNKIYII